MHIDLYNPNFNYEEPKNIKKWSSEYCEYNNDVNKSEKDNFFWLITNPIIYYWNDLKIMYQQNKEFEQTKFLNFSKHLEKDFNADFKENPKLKYIINGLTSG